MTFDRTMARARQSLAATLTTPFQSLEASADATAIEGFRFLALALEQRRDAGLPVTAGADAIDLTYRACKHAYHAQTLLRGAHAMWPALAGDYEFIAPECPPKASAVVVHVAAA